MSPTTPLALGLCLAALLAVPALAEVKVTKERPEVAASDVDAAPTDRPRPSDRRGGGIVNRLEIGRVTQDARGQGAVSKTIIGVIEDVEAAGTITNQVTIGTSTDIAIGAGARACSEIGTIGRATCR